MKNHLDMLENIVVIPHQIGYMPRIEKKNKTTKTLNIGLLGVLTKHKGGDIVSQLVDRIEKENLDIRIKIDWKLHVLILIVRYLVRQEHIQEDQSLG